MYSKVVTFGCSQTFGHGLHDIYSVLGSADNPSKIAYPSLIAKKFDIPVFNYALCGNSSKRLEMQIFEELWNIDKETLVIILWPHHSRSCVYLDGPTLKNTSFFNIDTPNSWKLFRSNTYALPLQINLPKNVDKMHKRISSMYYISYHELDALSELLMRINHIKSFLQDKCKNILNFSFIDFKELDDKIKSLPEPVKILGENLKEYKICPTSVFNSIPDTDIDKYATDKKHWGYTWHSHFAEEIINRLKLIDKKRKHELNL